MTIKVPQDWWDTVSSIIDDLPEYASKNGVEWNDDDFRQAVACRHDRIVYNMCNSLWMNLPDHAGIRVYPFFELCDLCSEYWVFDVEE